MQILAIVIVSSPRRPVFPQWVFQTFFVFIDMDRGALAPGVNFYIFFASLSLWLVYVNFQVKSFCFGSDLLVGPVLFFTSVEHIGEISQVSCFYMWVVSKIKPSLRATLFSTGEKSFKLFVLKFKNRTPSMPFVICWLFSWGLCGSVLRHAQAIWYSWVIFGMGGYCVEFRILLPGDLSR